MPDEIVYTDYLGNHTLIKEKGQYVNPFWNAGTGEAVKLKVRGFSVNDNQEIRGIHFSIHDLNQPRHLQDNAIDIVFLPVLDEYIEEDLVNSY